MTLWIYRPAVRINRLIILDYIGVIGAFLTTIAFLPQTIMTIKTRDTQSLSLTMYSLFIAGVICWLIYGITLMNYVIIWANIITLALALVILSIKINNVIRGRDS